MSEDTKNPLRLVSKETIKQTSDKVNTNFIVVKMNKIGDDVVNSVYLRDVYSFIESKQQFADWAKNRLQDFIEGVDFIVHKNMTEYNQVDRIEYIVTLDTAKHICMLERNQKGKELRQYFIECEKLAKKNVPQTYIQALEALLEAEKQKQEALAQAEYQNRALTTSQIRNAIKTREIKKLRAQVRGYADNYVSVLQYVTKENLNPKNLNLRTLTVELRKHAEAITNDKNIILMKRTLENDKFASWCFDLEFLDDNKIWIEVMINLLAQGKKLSGFRDVWFLF